MFKKEETPRELIKKSRKIIRKAGKKRNKLGESKNAPVHSDEWNELTGIMKDAYQDIEIAINEIKHPKPVPKYWNNSKNFTFKNDIAIGSNNKASLEANGHYHSGKNKNAKNSNSKLSGRSKAKLIFTLIGILCVVIVTAIISVKITNCVNKSKDNSSSIFTII